MLILTKETGLVCPLLEYPQINWPGCEFLPKEGLDIHKLAGGTIATFQALNKLLGASSKL